MDDIEIKYIEEARDLLSSAELKLMELLRRESKETYVEEIITPQSVSNFTIPIGKGKYQWYKLKDDDSVKLRKCQNEGCLLFLKWNDTKKKYEHWKYDANTGVGGFVQDGCDHYGGF